MQKQVTPKIFINQDTTYVRVNKHGYVNLAFCPKVLRAQTNEEFEKYYFFVPDDTNSYKAAYILRREITGDDKFEGSVENNIMFKSIKELMLSIVGT